MDWRVWMWLSCVELWAMLQSCTVCVWGGAQVPAHCFIEPCGYLFFVKCKMTTLDVISLPQGSLDAVANDTANVTLNGMYTKTLQSVLPER